VKLELSYRFYRLRYVNTALSGYLNTKTRKLERFDRRAIVSD